MITTELPLPFVVYDKREKQNRFKRNSIGTSWGGLLCPNDRILPFQFRVSGATAPVVSTWVLRPINGGSDVSLTSKIDQILIQAHESGFSLIYNGGGLLITIPCGLFESIITLSSGAVFYSEILEVVNYTEAEMPFLKIIWGNPCPLGRIFYSAESGTSLLTEGSDVILTEGGDPILTETGSGAGDFLNIVWLNEFLDETDPEVFEEVEKDGNGVEIPILQRFTNKLKTVTVVPDFLKNALIAMRIHKNIRVISPGGVHDLQVSRAMVTPSVDGSGAFSAVDMTFEIDQVIVSAACCG